MEETQPLVPAEAKKPKSGTITWGSENSHTAIFGATKWWTLMGLCFFGLLASLTWVILSIVASLPSEFPDATVVDIQLTSLSIIHGAIYFAFLLCIGWFTSSKIVVTIGKTQVSRNKQAWENIHPFNRINFKSWLAVQFFAFFGILIAQSVFAKDSHEMSHKYSNSMFTNGTITQLVAEPTSGNSCLRRIALHCNGNSTYTMDNIEAQSFININHITVAFSLLLAIGYFSHLLNLWWMELCVNKKSSIPLSHKITITYTRPGERDAIDVSPRAATMYIHEAKTEFSVKDGWMYTYKMALVLGGVLVTACLIIELLSLAGLSHGLCSNTDMYGGLYMLEICVNFVTVFVLGTSVLAIMMKDSLLKNMHANQKFTKIMSTLAMVLISVLFLTNGAFWLSSHQVPVTFTIPHPVLCRIHPDMRTYYANRVMEAVLSILLLFCAIDAYYVHSSKFGRRDLFAPKDRLSKKSHHT